jgi:hypothetical protein
MATRVPTPIRASSVAGVRYERRGAIRLVAVQPGDLDAEHSEHLLGDGGEHLGGGRLARDQCRHAPQCGLLIREPPHLCSRLGVGDRGGDELGEGCDPGLDIPREWPVLLGGGVHHAPEALVDDDRSPYRRMQAQLPAQCGGSAGGVFVFVYSCGPPGPPDQPGDALALEVDPCADRHLLAGATPGAEDRRRPVGLEPPQVRGVDTEEQGDLARDRSEQLRRRYSAGDQRRHAPQRGLLVRESRRSACVMPRARRQEADDQ